MALDFCIMGQAGRGIFGNAHGRHRILKRGCCGIASAMQQKNGRGYYQLLRG